MRNGYDLLTALYRKGVAIWTENGQLRYQSLVGSLLPEELSELRTRKAEFISVLEHTDVAINIPLLPRTASCIVPLNAMQRKTQQWSARFSGFAVRVLGKLNVDFLERSIEAVVHRHESLRTRFVVVDGTLRQHIDPIRPYRISVINLETESSPINVEARAARIAEAMFAQLVDISVGPLFEPRLLRFCDREHVLLLALDHMITDGASNEIISRDIWTLYHQIARGNAFSLPPLPVQYGDYCLWQQRTCGAWHHRHEGYWRERLRGAPRTQPPFDEGLRQVKPSVTVDREIAFGAVLSEQLRELTRREGALLSLVVLSVYVGVISRWCNQNDLVVYFATNGRYRAELKDMVGFIANTMYLRIKISERDTLLDLTKRVALEFQTAYEHLDFDRVPGLMPNVTPDLIFNWLPKDVAPKLAHDSSGTDDAIRLQEFPVKVTAPMNFYTFAYETSAGVCALVNYRVDLFRPETIERYAQNLRLFAEALVRDPLTLLAHYKLT